MMMEKWVATANDTGVRLATFLKSKVGDRFSGREIKRAIESNCCLINKTVENFSSVKLKKGDQVQFESAELPSKRELEIIYEDDHLLCYNKPAGMLSDVCSEQPIHRLDRDTTGLLLVAKTGQAYEKMVDMFRQRQVSKTYLALVDGILQQESGTVENKLARLQTEGKVQWGTSPEGKTAITEWQIVQKGKHATLVECHPITGRTHQIRVHMLTLGHPVLGDTQYYRSFRSPYHPKRPLLHASELRFSHPLTGRPIYLMAPLPEDFTIAMQEVLE